MSPRHALSVLITAVSATVPWWSAGPAGAQSPVQLAGDLGPTFGEVSDLCAFEFVLYDATAGGSRVSDTISRTLRVRGGLYETDLDFGAGALDGSSRYLEVAVGCPAATADLTTLTRRAFPSRARSRIGAEAATVGEQPGWATKAALGTGFTYQGELRSSGSPVTGSGDLRFSLWDAATGGSQIGSTVASNGVPVEGGRFTTTLDFGAAAFDGQARWLEIAVDFPSGTGSFTTLSPRQLISAAPYSLQTRGLYVNDAGDVGVGTLSPQARFDVADDGFSAMRVRSTAATGGVALQASAGSGSGWATAIEASTGSPDGAGLYAFNEAESGHGYALYGETTSPDGIAVYGLAGNDDSPSTSVGVYGRSDGDAGAVGVYGLATATGGTASGVRGDHQASGNYGALGAPNAGVRGSAGDPTDYAGYFTGGNLRVDADLELHTASGFKTIDLDPEYGAGNAGRIEVQGAGDYAVIQATGTGAGEGDATLRVSNTQPAGGVAAYATSSGDAPTVHIRNDGSGESLRLESRGGGDLLVAHDGAAGEDRLRVGGDGITHVADLEVTGAYRGTLGPNNGAPFPRPAYDSGWVAIDAGDLVAFEHDIGGSVDDYVVDLQFKSILPVLGVHNRHFGGAFIGADQTDPGFRERGAMWEGLTSSLVFVRREDDDLYSDKVRVRIWVVN